MPQPTSRDEIIEYALRKLGSPVVEINVDRQQCEDRLDDALDLFSQRHFDGVEKVYFKHQITSTDKSNMYIDTSALSANYTDGPNGKDIMSVIRVFQFGDFANISMFDVRYQMALSDYFGINRGLGFNSSMGLSSYDSTKRYINMIQDFFQPEKMIRFSKVSNKLHLDFNSEDLDTGNYLVIETYAKLISSTFSEIFNDIWLKKYLTSIIKRQWGANLSKFDGIQLPGGASLRGGEIVAEANQEIEAIEQELQLTYELPVNFDVG